MKNRLITIQTEARRRILLLLALQLLVVSVTFAIAYSTWAIKRDHIAAEAKQRVLVHGQLLSAIHSTMLNSFSSLTDVLGETDFGTTLDPQDRQMAESMLAGFIRTSYSFQHVLLLSPEGQVVLYVQRDGQNAVSVKEKDVHPSFIKEADREHLDSLVAGEFHYRQILDSLDISAPYSYSLTTSLHDSLGRLTGYVSCENQFGSIVSWVLGIEQVNPGHDFLLDRREYLLNRQGESLPTTSAEWIGSARENVPELDHFSQRYPEEWASLAAGNLQLTTKNGLFTAEMIDWVNHVDSLREDRSNRHPLSWVFVQQIPQERIVQELWSAIRMPIIIGFFVDLFGSFLLLSYLAAHSARKQAMLRLNELNTTMNAIIDGAPLAMIVLGRTGTVLHWNSAAANMFGWKEEEVLGQIDPIVDDQNQNNFEEIFQETITSNKPVEANIVRKHRDGHILELHLWTTPIAYIEGHPSAILGVLADVSEQLRAQETETRAKRMDTARQLARTVAHEFRQPLAALSMLTELVEIHNYEPQEMQVALSRIPRLVERMDNLVDKLLNLTELNDKTYWRDINILDLAQDDLDTTPEEEERDSNLLKRG